MSTPIESDSVHITPKAKAAILQRRRAKRFRRNHRSIDISLEVTHLIDSLRRRLTSQSGKMIARPGIVAEAVRAYAATFEQNSFASPDGNDEADPPMDGSSSISAIPLQTQTRGSVEDLSGTVPLRPEAVTQEFEGGSVHMAGNTCTVRFLRPDPRREELKARGYSYATQAWTKTFGTAEEARCEANHVFSILSKT